MLRTPIRISRPLRPTLPQCISPSSSFLYFFFLTQTPCLTSPHCFEGRYYGGAEGQRRGNPSLSEPYFLSSPSP
ncbi:hypothetical protein BDW66DRAFT_1944 [Aspergillus desertorum]